MANRERTLTSFRGVRRNKTCSPPPQPMTQAQPYHPPRLESLYRYLIHILVYICMYVLVPAISDLRREDLLRIITAQTLPTASDNPGPTLPPTRTRSISVFRVHKYHADSSHFPILQAHIQREEHLSDFSSNHPPRLMSRAHPYHPPGPGSNSEVDK